MKKEDTFSKHEGQDTQLSFTSSAAATGGPIVAEERRRSVVAAVDHQREKENSILAAIEHETTDSGFVLADEVADGARETSCEGTVASCARDDNRANTRSAGSRGTLRNVGALRNSGSSRLALREKRVSSLNKNTSDFTVNKLQFKRLGQLYGRDEERTQLQDAWDAVRLARTTDSRKEAVNVRGKSALAETLRLSVIRKGGFYALGKFPQQRRLSRQSIEPYAAFAAACSDLCVLVVTLSSPEVELIDNPSNRTLDVNSYHEETDSSVASRKYYKFTLAEFRDRLDKNLGDAASVLTRVIPGLLQILKAGTRSESLGYREAHHQFKFVFRRFIRAVTSFGPLVLVLDDMQWADTASMELLEAIISDRESISLLIIGCYRDEEIFSHMPHIKTIDRIRSAAEHDTRLQVGSISIGNLDVSQIHKLLVDLLSLPDSHVSGLAGCVYRKTMGNIFFVIQFVTLLVDCDLLVFNLGALKWSFDLKEIQLLTAATENVVSLVKNKMKSLPAPIVKVLPIMGCLGSTFNVALFELVMKHLASSWESEPEDSVNEENQADPEQNRPTSINSRALQCLTRCEDEGLIESGYVDGEECYLWVHDKLQEASFALLSDEELQNLKLQLGKILYEHLPPRALDNHLFLVANLLNTESTGPDCYPRQWPVEIATLYLRAGIKAIENSAFEQAAGFLYVGIELLPSDHWQTNHQLSLDIFSTAAEAEFCSGNFDRMRGCCSKVVEQES